MNPILRQRLLRIVRQKDAEAFLEALASLSVSDFRSASSMMREGILGELEAEDFWTFFHTIVPTNPRAYLGTFLKAAATKYAYGEFPLSAKHIARFCTWASDIDKRKFAQAFLPIIKSPEEICVLMDGLALPSQAHISLLLPVATPQAAYALFQHLRRIEGESQTLRSVCIALMRRGDGQAFALASMLKSYFGIEDLPGTFSLHLEPFHFSGFSDNYETFRKLISTNN